MVEFTLAMSLAMLCETDAVSATRWLASFTPMLAWAMFVATSLVTVDCSSMAAAIDDTMSPTSLMTCAIFSMSPMAPPVDA